MKKINYLTTLCLIATASFIVSSCTKSNVKPKTVVPNSAAVGYWYGTFLNNNGFGSSVGILFRNDGTIKLYDFYGASSLTDTTKSTNAAGTYTITGGTINFSYTFPGENFTAQGTINSSAGGTTLPYTFTDPASAGYSGTGTVTKQ
jgi:hypothetical protein